MYTIISGHAIPQTGKCLRGLAFLCASHDCDAISRPLLFILFSIMLILCTPFIDGGSVEKCHHMIEYSFGVASFGYGANGIRMTDLDRRWATNWEVHCVRSENNIYPSKCAVASLRWALWLDWKHVFGDTFNRRNIVFVCDDAVYLSSPARRFK